jgi:hypothetical protein
VVKIIRFLPDNNPDARISEGNIPEIPLHKWLVSLALKCYYSGSRYLGVDDKMYVDMVSMWREDDYLIYSS